MEKGFWDILDFRTTNNFKRNSLVNLIFPEDDLCLAYLDIPGILEFYFDISGEIEVSMCGQSWSQSEIKSKPDILNIVREMSEDIHSKYFKNGWELTKTPKLTFELKMPRYGIKVNYDYWCQELQGDVWCKGLMLMELQNQIKKKIDEGELKLTEEDEAMLNQLNELEIYSVRTTPFHPTKVSHYWNSILESEDLIDHCLHIEGEVDKHFINFFWHTHNEKANRRIFEIVQG